MVLLGGGFKNVIYIQVYFIFICWGLENQAKDLFRETEVIVRNITFQLFSDLTFSNMSPRIKQSILFHNYFVNLTLMDQQTLNLIFTISRVDTNLNHITFDANDTMKNEDNNYIKTDPLLSQTNKNGLIETKNILSKNENNTSTSVDEFLRTNMNDDIARVLKIDSSEHLKKKTLGNDYISSNHSNLSLAHVIRPWVPEQISNLTRRIYKGKDIRKNEYPFIASIHIHQKFHCAGSIIRSDLIVTAASCLQLAWDDKLYKDNPYAVYARVGTDFYNFGGETVAILEIHFHPAYNPRNLHNNIAILRLRRHLRFHKGIVSKIEYERETMLEMENTVTIVGWGWKGVDVHELPSKRLSYDVLDVYNITECVDIYSSEYMTEKHFCAGFTSRGSGACSKDVGGPGLADGMMIGIISYGPMDCGTPDAPTVFTKIAYYSDWIDSIVKKPHYTMSTLQEPEYDAEQTTLIPFHKKSKHIQDNGKYKPLATPSSLEEEEIFIDLSLMFKKFWNFITQK